MGYGALTAFLGLRQTEQGFASAMAAHCHGKTLEELTAIFLEEAPKLLALKDKANRVDDLEREVVNLRWNLNRTR